jgi:hypothetical protein
MALTEFSPMYREMLDPRGPTRCGHGPAGDHLDCHPECHRHRGAATWLSYYHGRLTIRCEECGEPIVTIAVASLDAAPECRCPHATQLKLDLFENRRGIDR